VRIFFFASGRSGCPLRTPNVRCGHRKWCIFKIYYLNEYWDLFSNLEWFGYLKSFFNKICNLFELQIDIFWDINFERISSLKNLFFYPLISCFTHNSRTRTDTYPYNIWKFYSFLLSISWYLWFPLNLRFLL